MFTGLNNLGLNQSQSFSPQSLFTGGADGLWLDASMLSSMYQDSAGTTPETAVEQQIGAMLDRKYGATSLAGRGNHLTQSTAGNLPLVSARYNLLTKTEQLTDPVWAKPAGGEGTQGTGITPVVTENFGAAPNGTQTADRVQFSLGVGGGNAAGAANRSGLNQVMNLPVGSYSQGFYVKALDGTNLVSALASGQLNFVLAQGGSYAHTPNDIGNGWLRVTSPIAASTTTGGFRLQLVSVAGGTIDSLDLLIWGIDLRTANDAALNIPAYQRVNTSTDYDTVGFPLKVRADGTNDSLSTTSGGGGTTGFFLCAAITVSGGAATNRVIWNDIGTNTGYQVAVDSGNKLAVAAGDGVGFTTLVGDNLPVGETHVITVWDDGTNIYSQVDNNFGIYNTPRPVVSAGSAGITLFKSNTGALSYFFGDCHQLVYVKNSGLTAAQRAQVKRYVGAKVGISL